MNPEFKRYLWLELSPHRLIATPLVIALLAFLAARFDSPGELRTLSNIAFSAYILLVFIWGAKLASESIADEVRDNTWDFQRMSSLSPWSMVWGKIFGSTIFTWYAGGFCLLLYLWGDWATGTEAYHSRLSWALTLILFGVAAQALGFITATLMAREGGRSHNQGWLLLILLLPFIFGGTDNVSAASIHWYEWNIASRPFILVGVAMGTAWLLTGAYRLMRKELLFDNRPWVWLLFLLWCALYFAGFINGELEGVLSLRLLLFFGLLVTLSYGLLLAEPISTIELRRLMTTMGDEPALLWRRLPLWLVTLCLTGVIEVVLLFSGDAISEKIFEQSYTPWMAPILFLFLLRDTALILLIRLSRRTQRAVMTAALYLFLLYFPANWLIELLGLDLIRPIFLPLPQQGVGSWLLLPLIVHGAFIFFVLSTLRSRIGLQVPVAGEQRG